MIIKLLTLPVHAAVEVVDLAAASYISDTTCYETDELASATAAYAHAVMENAAYNTGKTTIAIDDAFNAFKACTFAVNHLSDGTTTQKWRDTCLQTETFDVNDGITIPSYPESCYNYTTFEPQFQKYVNFATMTHAGTTLQTEEMTESEMAFMLNDLLCDELCDGCTEAPTESPTGTPTNHPTENPTGTPTAHPTDHPTDSPTAQPTEPPSYSFKEVTDFDTFNTLFIAAGGILERQCDGCADDYKDMYYRRTSAMPDGFDWEDLFRENWFSSNNILGTDFELYSSVEDMESGVNMWEYCNYDDSTVGFPRDCGKTQSSAQGWQWNSISRTNGQAVRWYIPQ